MPQAPTANVVLWARAWRQSNRTWEASVGTGPREDCRPPARRPLPPPSDSLALARPLDALCPREFMRRNFRRHRFFSTSVRRRAMSIYACSHGQTLYQSSGIPPPRDGSCLNDLSTRPFDPTLTVWRHLSIANSFLAAQLICASHLREPRRNPTYEFESRLFPSSSRSTTKEWRRKS